MSILPDNSEEDQANELRHLFQETVNEEETNKETPAVREVIEIDVLNLPPRREVHTKNKRLKFKFSKPFIRLLVIVLLVVLSIATAFYIWQDEFFSMLHRL